MSVIGFDFGSYSSYVALVRTGGIDTVDNDYSYRSTPTSVSFTNLMRFSGNSSKTQSVTNFRNTFSCFKNLIGLSYDDHVAQTEMKYLTSSFIPLEDGSIGVECSYREQHCVFSIPQLVAIMLVDLKKTALAHSPKANDCVLSVPCFFNDNQRRILIESCQIANITPLALINDTAAVAYNYALFKSDLPEDDKPPRYVMFVDVGYSCVQISISSFNKSKVSVLSSFGTNEIGGRIFDKLICDKFCDEFMAKHKVDLRKHKKSYLKLINEAEAVKKQMNTTSVELPIKVDCLFEEIDFSSKICREEFDAMAGDIYIHLAKIIKVVLDRSNISVENIHSVEAVGGSSRILGIRSVIKNVIGKECSTTLNADEAVSRGCAIQCALVSPGIRIRNIDLKDYSLSEYSISYLNKKGDEKNIIILKEGGSIPRLDSISFLAVEDHKFDVTERPVLGEKRIIASCRSFGMDPVSCNADKVSYTVKFELSNIFSLVKAFFIENKVVDENQKDEQSVKDVGSQSSSSKTVKINHPIEFECLHTMSIASKLPAYISMEKEMQDTISYERSRSAAKNELEEFIYSTREKLSSVYKDFATSDETSHISSSLTKEEDWLYGDGEFVSIEEYGKHFSYLKEIFLPVQSRFEGFEKSFHALETLSGSLGKYRNFIHEYNTDRKKYDFLPLEEVEACIAKVNFCDNYLEDSGKMLTNQPRTRLPCVNAIDIEAQRSELVSLCEKIIKKSMNPPKVSPPPTPKVEEPESQSKSTENSIEPDPEQIESDKNAASPVHN